MGIALKIAIAIVFIGLFIMGKAFGQAEGTSPSSRFGNPAEISALGVIVLLIGILVAICALCATAV